MEVQTRIPESDKDRSEQVETLHDLQAGDTLDGRTVVAVTHIPQDDAQVQAPGAVVTTIWQTWGDGTAQYATRFLNKQTGGQTGGHYAHSLQDAGEAHAEQVARYHPEKDGPLGA